MVLPEPRTRAAATAWSPLRSSGRDAGRVAAGAWAPYADEGGTQHVLAGSSVYAEDAGWRRGRLRPARGAAQNKGPWSTQSSEADEQGVRRLRLRSCGIDGSVSATSTHSGMGRNGTVTVRVKARIRLSVPHLQPFSSERTWSQPLGAREMKRPTPGRQAGRADGAGGKRVTVLPLCVSLATAELDHLLIFLLAFEFLL